MQALKEGRLESAEQLFLEILEKEKRDPRVSHNLGIVYQMARRHREAVDQFRRALDENPDSTPSRLLLANSLLALDQPQQAIAQLQVVLGAEPENRLAQFHLARAYEASGNFLEAVESYGKLRRLEPQNPEYAYRLGRAYLKLSEWCLQEILRLAPDSGRLHQARGQQLALQGKLDLAIEAYEEAVRADPGTPELNYGLALLYRERGRLQEALEAVERELVLNPEFQAARQLKSELQLALAP